MRSQLHFRFISQCLSASYLFVAHTNDMMADLQFRLNAKSQYIAHQSEAYDAITTVTLKQNAKLLSRSALLLNPLEKWRQN